MINVPHQRFSARIAAMLGKQDPQRVAELAWAAGFFDGEGTIYAQRRRLPSGKWSSPVPSVTVTQVDPDVLYRFAGIVSAPRVLGPYTYNKGRQPNAQSHYRIHLVRDPAVEVIRQLWPYLCEIKREQYREVQRKCLSQKRGSSARSRQP